MTLKHSSLSQSSSTQKETTPDTVNPAIPIRLIQGYLWHPKGEIRLETYLPSQWDQVHLLWDEIHPPFAFFENGALASSQAFYQFTALEIYAEKPSDDALHRRAEALSIDLDAWLNATPAGIGWQLWEDLRPLE